MPWVFLVCTRGAVNRCSPSRVKSQSAFGIVEMAALHQYRAAAQQRPPLLQHFPFVTRMGASSSAAASGRFG